MAESWRDIQAYDLQPNDIYYCGNGDENANNNTAVRNIRFQMSLSKHTSIAEWLRLKFNCPLGLRIHLKKRTVARCRKLKKWFHAIKNDVLMSHSAREIPSPLPSWYNEIFGNNEHNFENTEMYSAMNLSPNSTYSDESMNTVIYTPKVSPHFVPVSKRFADNAQLGQNSQNFNTKIN